MQAPDRKKITYVEDAPSDVYLLRQALEEHGVECDLLVISDGEQALTYVSGIQAAVVPDLIILDLSLPRHTGLEVLACWRRTAGTERIPVLIFTSSNSPFEQAAAEELGVDAYVRKPILLEDFMRVGRTIRQLLEPHERAAFSMS